MTIEAVERGFFAREYALFEGTQEIGVLRPERLGEGAEANIDGRVLSFERSNFWTRQYIARHDGEEFATAAAQRFFHHTIEFSDGERRFELANAGLFKRECVIRHQGMRIGSVRAYGFGHRRVAVDTPSEWSDDLAVFVLWLALGAWRRRAMAAAVAAGG